jgi:transposase
MQEDCLTTLLGIQGFHVVRIEWQRGGEKQGAVIVHLRRSKAGYVCGQCGKPAPGYDSHWQDVQHLAFWNHLTFLRFKRHRVECPRCGVRTEALDFVGIRGHQITHPLAQHVSELCKVMPNKAVGLLHALHKHTVKDIDKEAMAMVQAHRPLDGFTVLGADEIAAGQGQKYLTMISAMEGPRGPELLDVVEGRRERSLGKFWKWFGKKRAKQITHGVMDMWEPFRNSFTKHCRGIKIIYDKFHVIQYLQEALNDVRKAELSTALGRFKKTLSGKKFSLMARQRYPRRQPEASQSVSAQGILRPDVGLQLQSLHVKVLGGLEGQT